ncbi:hypothetical protein K449DRAFT_334000 [Hypoxylon sp. EC38]|nr:hypothetical protein K449DRAFT_334000 [Hypoxylon sp. EC38]
MASTLVNGSEDHVESGGEWTKVLRKGRRHLHTHQHQHTLSCSHGTVPRSNLRQPFLSVSDIESEHQRITDQWGTSMCCRQLQQVVASRPSGPTITHAVCFGLGSFDPDDGSWESRRRAHVQLAAFLCMVEELQRSQPQPIHCLFQEPVFNSADKNFICSLGYKVVDSPEGFEQVGPSTLVFGIHLYKDVYAQAIDGHPPAIFVGTPREIWEECHGSDSLDWVKLKELDAQCDKVKFPEDGEYTTFSGTTIHWRRRGTV